MAETKSAFAVYCDNIGKRRISYKSNRTYSLWGDCVENSTPYTDLVLLKMYASKRMPISISGPRSEELANYLCVKAHKKSHPEKERCNITSKQNTDAPARDNPTINYRISSEPGRILDDAITAAELGNCVLVYPPSRHARRFVMSVKRAAQTGFVEAINKRDLKSYDAENIHAIDIDWVLKNGLFSHQEMWLIGWPTDPEQRMHAGFPLSEKDERIVRNRDQRRLVNLLRHRGTRMV